MMIQLLNYINKLNKYKWIFRALIPSIYLNFRKLPFKQAIKLPILVYKPRFISLKGEIIIDCPVSFGMIKLGHMIVPIYPNNGIMIENNGMMIFKGKASIGNDSYVSIGPFGNLEIGENLLSTCSLKLVCFNNISFSPNVLIGWNTMFCDTDFHTFRYSNGKQSKGIGTIQIGEDVWFGNGCKVYKNVRIPSKCIVAADSIITKSPDTSERSLICNERIIIKKASDISWNRNEDGFVNVSTCQTQQETIN